MKMKQFLLYYLDSPAERRAETEAAMLQNPDEAFEAIQSFRGPYPAHTHIVDVFPDYIAPLLTELIRSCPRLVLDLKPEQMRDGKRWILTQAAIETEDTRFAGFILSGLKDRSPLVRLLVVEAIAEYPFLQLPEAVPQLQKLLTFKSLAYDREEIENALNAINRRMAQARTK